MSAMQLGITFHTTVIYCPANSDPVVSMQKLGWQVADELKYRTDSGEQLTLTVLVRAVYFTPDPEVACVPLYKLA